MDTQDAIFANVVELLQEYAGKERRLDWDTTLFGDLGIWGDDAGDFLTELAERFEVDFSRFRFHRHFRAEGYSLLDLLLLPFRIPGRCLGTTPEEDQNLIPITIRQLVAAIEQGRWPAEWSDLKSGSTLD